MSTASSELRFAGGGRERELAVRRSARARGFRLAVDPRDGSVRLTLPARAALAPALAWAAGQRAWVERALAALPPPAPLAAGVLVPFLGIDRQLHWSAAAGRAVRVEATRLIVGGPEALVGARLLRWLRGEALARLDAATRAAAARAGVGVGRVGVGDPRSRWGSCSAAGDIRYSWRLVLAPPAVLAATVAHEVAHRRHMHHGAAFHAHVAELFGRDPAPERRWLAAHGPRLQAFGREG